LLWLFLAMEGSFKLFVWADLKLHPPYFGLPSS
jgi:hypothetical protein